MCIYAYTAGLEILLNGFQQAFLCSHNNAERTLSIENDRKYQTECFFPVADSKLLIKMTHANLFGVFFPFVVIFLTLNVI